MSTIKVGTLLHSDGTTTTQPSIPALDQRMAKAWVNFNGTGTVAIRDSENVSSITDAGTGNYYVNYSTSLANTNYCVVSANTNTESNNATLLPVTWATSSIRVSSRNGSASVMDGSLLNVVVMGG